MKASAYWILVMPLLIVLSLPAAAWGPRALLSIVTTSTYLIAKEHNIPLTSREKEVRTGASISAETLRQLFPDADNDPIGAVESEMRLLQAVNDNRMDAYFSYRLGALGKLVARTTAPMQKASPTYRNLYYADTDSNIHRATLAMSERVQVEPGAYLPARIAAANTNNDVIQREYQEGIGFNGVASRNLAADASRSVGAVTDVWHTILTVSTTPGNVSNTRLREYVVDAMVFYVRRGNPTEIDAKRRQLANLVPETPEMQVRIGDLFYNADLRERAVNEYQQVLAAEPNRRDVVQKIAAYYLRLGEEALADNKLETALEAFERTLEVDPLYPSGAIKRLEARKLIEARNARLARNLAAIEAAEEFEMLAERQSLRNNFADAIEMLIQARDAYSSVTSEFQAEYSKRERALLKIRSRTQGLRQEIMTNAQIFRGSGFAQDIQQLARTGNEELDKDALRALVRKALEDELGKLEKEMEPILAVP